MLFKSPYGHYRLRLPICRPWFRQLRLLALDDAICDLGDNKPMTAVVLRLTPQHIHTAAANKTWEPPSIAGGRRKPGQLAQTKVRPSVNSLVRP